MADDLSQLDNIIESDILEALGQVVPDNVNSDASEEDLVQNVPDEYMLTEDELPSVDTVVDEELDNNQAEVVEDVSQETEDTTQSNSSAESVTLNSSSSGDLLAVLSQLLNNKTIEITIKIKD